ncbi:polysaccharide export outer membrane protein [Halopseudomonas sabulinigri]|uniref:Polysaccharide export outer membrane protein n=1 Tax=Halopseudomonas sabulinigri TaxID=472181 RepID=A0A1H1L7M0_9GAMM|nr:polysaccharide biosynthesis/export family protein [Halopseudomonas sabulinigri]SDR70427.1 polysaccharide export outer membrane protein [Halopseudomonas sabulinigri]
MNRFSFAALGTSALLLQACMFSPGMHMDTDRLLAEDSVEESLVEMVQITPKVLAQEQAVATNRAVPQELLNFVPENYRLGPNDSLFITVWDHPELTIPGGQQQTSSANSRVVRDDGTLFYPFVGSIKVAGLTQEELRKLLSDKLSRYIEQPQVDVNILEYNSQKVTLSGAFVTPGFREINSQPLTLLQAVGEAVIDNERADLSTLNLIRDGQVFTLDYDYLTSHPSAVGSVYLKAGDKLHMGLNDARKVFIMGEVPRPAALSYSTSRMTLSEVLATVGGPSPTSASGREVYVIRGVENLETEKATIFQLNAQSPSAFILADQFEMQPQDVVFVGAAGITRWNRFVSQLFPSANILGTAVNIGNDYNDLSNNN